MTFTIISISVKRYCKGLVLKGREMLRFCVLLHARAKHNGIVSIVCRNL